MNNITMEQREKAFENFINSDPFKSLVDERVNARLTYYEWLKKYFRTDNEKSFNNNLDYINNCRMIDTTKQTSIVYFIRNKYTGYVKIGKTTDLRRRFKEIQNGFHFLGLDTHELILEAIAYCPYGVDNSKVETYYHQLFKDYRKNGEWFDVSYDQLMNTLIIDYVINGVFVTVEDVLDYKPDYDFKVVESDVETLRNKEKNELIKKYEHYFGFYNSDIFSRLLTDKEIYSNELYDYIIKQTTLNLNDKIKENIKSILDVIF